MKRLAWFTGIILVTVTLLVGINMRVAYLERPTSATATTKTLTIFNWGDYIDPALLKKFEKQTGYQVDYETFDSNEAMLTKVEKGGTHYDILIPSDYMIQKMKKQNLLLPLDHSKLTGYQNYDPRFLNQPFDKGNKYSLPYFWGTLGIVYNDKYVKADEVKTWNDLWNTKWRDSIMLYDSSRDMMGMALAANGDSINSKHQADLMAAKGRLDALMPNVKAIIADEMKMYMVQDEAKIAVDYSGDASIMVDENPHLHYVVPNGAGNIWFDNMVIPKSVQNKPAAYAFMNFMSEPKNAADNAIYNGYATPNQAAAKLLPKATLDDQQWYPKQSVLDKLTTYEDLGPYWTEEYNDLFLEFKMTTKR
ncbi:MAG: ABC transporter substrate-binding protein [Lactobacillaceae bacterium]|jgi:spermidine/putrescine transport system substrate-binding protein|nr:ABC transporter substrate-binding protein [Lactobacillaceae bacterium]